MTEREIENAKSFAGIFGGITAIAAGVAGSYGYALPAAIAGGFLIIIGIAQAIGGKGHAD